MNILFFLTPKSEVAYINCDDTLSEALEKMESHHYAAVPLLNHQGKYMGTLTEGDLLWGLKSLYDSQKDTRRIRITEIPRRQDNQPVLADAAMEDLLEKVINQNFVPVLDDHRCFIGIITRKDVIRYLCKKQQPYTLSEKL